MSAVTLGQHPLQVVSSPSQGTFTQGQRTFWQWGRNRISTQSEKTELALEMSASLCEKSPGLAVPLSAGAARSLTVGRKGKAVPWVGSGRVLRQLC